MHRFIAKTFKNLPQYSNFSLLFFSLTFSNCSRECSGPVTCSTDCRIWCKLVLLLFYSNICSTYTAANLLQYNKTAVTKVIKIFLHTLFSRKVQCLNCATELQLSVQTAGTARPGCCSSQNCSRCSHAARTAAENHPAPAVASHVQNISWLSGVFYSQGDKQYLNLIICSQP